ncbi:MAG: cytoskeleton protein RodZ [Alphaproteobacteria bacterium]|jgi:cytoskeleton protein RodZ
MTIEFGVGKELRAARLKAELKINEVAEELNLRVEHVIAIEKDQYADLPGSTYVVGFVKSYARLLGLNDVHLVDRLMQSDFIPNLAPETPLMDGEKESSPAKNLLGIAFLVLLLVSILAAIYFFYASTENTLTSDVQVEVEGDVAVPEAAIEKDIVAKPVKEALIPQLMAETAKAEKDADVAKPIKIIGTKPEGARVMLTAVEDAWYQVYNPKTKKTYLNAVLKSGQSVWLKSDPDALMDLGRPHKVKITIDGKEQGIAGPSWGGVIKNLSIDGDYLIHDYYGKGLNDKSYNQWIKNR